MKQYIRILACFFLLCSSILLFSGCHKETTASTATVIPQPLPGEYNFDSLSWHTHFLSGLWVLGGFGNLFGGVIQDSAYYNDHIQVFLKFVGDSVWKSVAYVPQNYTGQNTPSIYFTVDNIDHFESQRVTPYMIIFGKPRAPVNYSLKVYVKVIIAP
jgi:hypothetical protein